MVNVAMIGGGGYAFELIKRCFIEPRKLNMVAVSSNPARKSAGREFCEKQAIPVYPDADSMLESITGKARVIMIPTSIESHYPLAQKCLQAGFDIFLEKPPVATIQDHDSLISLAESKGKRIAVMFQYLFSPIIQQIKSRIAEGEFGKVICIRGTAGWSRLDSYYDRSAWAGKLRIDDSWVLDGTVNNPLAHMLAAELYFASPEPGKMAEPASVQAELYRAHDIESEDTSSVRIITTDGIEIIFNATLCSNNTSGTTIIAEYEKATIEYINFDRAVITFRDSHQKQFLTNEVEPRVYMLSQLADCYESSESYAIDLERCRPFTVCVNGAFESCGTIHSVPADNIERIEQDDSIKTVIKGIDRIIAVSGKNGKLFSETGVSWAKSSKPLNVGSYTEFSGAGFRP